MGVTSAVRDMREDVQNNAQKNMQNDVQNNMQNNAQNEVQKEAACGLGVLTNEVRLELSARGENVALARAFTAGFVAAQWDLTLPVLEEIKVAVSEAVSNAIIHGYGGQEAAAAAKNFVGLRLCRYERGLLVAISDRGVGIGDIRRAMEPDFTTKPEHLGLGFAFMNTFMDRVRVESAPGEGTRVELVRLLPDLAVAENDEAEAECGV